MACARGKTVRFEINLSPWENNKSTIINYNALLEKELATVARSEPPSPNSPSDSQRRPSIVLPAVPQLHRRSLIWDMSDFRSLGAGYQEDSFIDNSETCDESVTSSHMHMGYCIHSKIDPESEFESDSECESVINPQTDVSLSDSDHGAPHENTPNCEPYQKNSSLLCGIRDESPEAIQSKSTKTLRTMSSPPLEQRHRLSPNHHKSEPLVITLDNSPPESEHEIDIPVHYSDEFTRTAHSGGSLLTRGVFYFSSENNKTSPFEEPSCSDEMSTMKEIHIDEIDCEKPSCSTNDTSVQTVARNDNLAMFSTRTYVDEVPCVTLSPSESLMIRSSQNSVEEISHKSQSCEGVVSTHPIPDSSTNVQHSTGNEFEGLTQPPQLPQSVIALLDTVMLYSVPDKKKGTLDNMSEVLLKLGDECRQLPASTRMYVYESIARHWDCSVKSVPKRFSRLRSQVDEQPVKDSIIRLRSQLEAESEIGINRDHGENIFTSADAEMLRRAVRAKSRWLEQHPRRKGSATEALLRFVESDVLALWRPGGPAASTNGAAFAAAANTARQEVRRLAAAATATTATTAAQTKCDGPTPTTPS